MKPDQDDMSGKSRENEQADDVATLYSWANLHGAKYRDFSAARQEMRAQMRQRAIAERAQQAREEAQKGASLEGNPLWEDLLPEGGRATGTLSGRTDPLPRGGMEQKRPENGNIARVERITDRPPERAPERPAEWVEDWAASGMPQAQENQARRGRPVREEVPAEPARPANGRPAEEDIGPPVRPAWLGEQKVYPQAPGSESLQQSRERVASRWFALRGIFGRGPEEAPVERMEGQAPVLVLFSLAGGVGKTSLAAAIGRALAARGERLLLADTCSFGLLPFYFGAREVKPGMVRTFSGGASDPPIQVMTLEAERESGEGELLRRELGRGAQDANRVVIDIATGSAAMLRQALRLAPTVLVPVVPDMASVMTLQSLEAFFRNQESLTGKPLQAWYLLNQFDSSMPLQLDVREVLRQQLGERLLPFAIHRSAAVSEALAEGMTVIDYAPNSPAAEDIMNLATWIRNTSVAVAAGHRGVRWSER
ncbi:MAG TPA: cellulose biosynthesis protein BcsQ [Acidobacteriaceae bacterium]|jgi:cellulose synthase operon protein YhjQ|nr:cellulose biosynthesis protein BcsQ [Acidobacteriaceae bacterium]